MSGAYDWRLQVLPCTPAGIMKLIASTGVSITGRECRRGALNIVVKCLQAVTALHQTGTGDNSFQTGAPAEVCRRAGYIGRGCSGSARRLTAALATAPQSNVNDDRPSSGIYYAGSWRCRPGDDCHVDEKTRLLPLNLAFN